MGKKLTVEQYNQLYHQIAVDFYLYMVNLRKGLPNLWEYLEFFEHHKNNILIPIIKDTLGISDIRSTNAHFKKLESLGYVTFKPSEGYRIYNPNYDYHIKNSIKEKVNNAKNEIIERCNIKKIAPINSSQNKINLQENSFNQSQNQTESNKKYEEEAKQILNGLIQEE